MKIFVLATLRNPNLGEFTYMVFDTIRTGFPTYEIEVHGNNLGDKFNDELLSETFHYTNIPATIHHKWIEQLIKDMNEPFWIVDTDVIFYESFEGLALGDAPLAGRRIPEFLDEFSGCLTRSRLHTSLLYINPEVVKKRVESFTSKLAKTEFTPLANLIYPIIVPFKGVGTFYDTCSQLYHTVGGQPFSEQQLDSYFHFNFGTISDLVLPRLNGYRETMEKARDLVVKDPSKGRGAWRYQDQWYAARQA